MKTIREQLAPIAGKNFSTVNALKLGKAGVDHLNLHSSTDCTRSRNLAPDQKTDFEHPVLGKFLIIEGLWAYLKLREERCRLFQMRMASQIARLPAVVANEEAIVAHTFYLQLSKLHSNAANWLRKRSDLPLVMYSENEFGLRTQINDRNFYLHIYSGVIRAMAEGKIVEYISSLAKTKLEDIYCDLAPLAYVNPQTLEVERRDQQSKKPKGRGQTSSILHIDEVAEPCLADPLPENDQADPVVETTVEQTPVEDYADKQEEGILG